MVFKQAARYCWMHSGRSTAYFYNPILISNAQATIITALTALAIKPHPTEPTLAESKHRILAYSHMDQAQAIYSLLSIVAGPMFLLVTSPHLYMSPISPADLPSNPYISWQREASAPICWLFWSSHKWSSNKPPDTAGCIQEGPQLIFTILF